MKVSEIRDLSPEELEDAIGNKEEELANLKFQHSLHQLDNTSKVRSARRELARMKTILTEHVQGRHELQAKKLIDEDLL